MIIDTTFDFTTDSPGYWDDFWKRNDGLGYGGSDPDSVSSTLKEYHRLLWSKPLPNGEMFDLKGGKGIYYLKWRDMDLSSDSIIVSFRYKKYRHMMEQVRERVDDFESYFEKLIHRSYTIGGMIIFPAHKNSLNQSRGRSSTISDRWDLTLECIRRYYAGETSPLSKTIEADKAFFDLFIDFKGYVDFFFLQDCVSSDYSSVDIWVGDAAFKESGLPRTIDEYFIFIDKELAFLDKRNARIKDDPLGTGLGDQRMTRRQANADYYYYT